MEKEYKIEVTVTDTSKVTAESFQKAKEIIKERWLNEYGIKLEDDEIKNTTLIENIAKKLMANTKEKMLKCHVEDCSAVISKEELDENAAYTDQGNPHCPNHYPCDHDTGNKNIEWGTATIDELTITTIGTCECGSTLRESGVVEGWDIEVIN